ncbi:MAG: ADP-ribosylglycohydrolase family protein [Planctomycetota bacterium]|jgi:ADP-ribosylglycohydrolase
MPDRAQRIRNALWGLFTGDALAMPAHWFYRLENIEEVFDGGITGYVDAPHPHPEAFMVGMAYRPDVDKAQRLARPFDILHEHVRFYNTNYSTLAIATGERESEHGNATPALEERYHYHHGLKAGENTLGAHLVRVLMRSVVRRGRYEPRAFVDDFVEHLVTPGRNKDPYTEIYLRRWFENYTRGAEHHNCAEQQRHVWSIGSHGGMIRPMVLSMLAPSAYQGLGFAIEHGNLTHRSEIVGSALGVTVPLLHELLGGADAAEAAGRHAGSVRVPRVTREELFAAYRDHGGPGNIDPAEMWRLHNELVDAPFVVDEYDEQRFANACYAEHGVPLALNLMHRERGGVEAALLANANAGGDNVHRGMVLGLLAGAAHDEFPPHLIEGLAARNGLAEEIDAFVELALGGVAL